MGNVSREDAKLVGETIGWIVGWIMGGFRGFCKKLDMAIQPVDGDLEGLSELYNQ
jgi:hypothetical protein